MTGQTEEKRLAALAAIAEVEDGMLLGLGTGSTVAFALTGLAERLRGGLRVRAVATSLRTHSAAQALGIDMLDFASFGSVDLCIDGVDEIDPGFRAIKGAGGALLREKIVAQAATRMIAIADSGKPVERLGRGPIPVEVLPFGERFVAGRLEALGGDVRLRQNGGEAYRTDQGNLVMDCHFAQPFDPVALADALAAIPGVMAHGLFLSEIDALYVAGGAQVTRSERRLS
jgi:ribose 5-phosphate isomerase A